MYINTYLNSIITNKIITIVVYQVVVGIGATLSVVGASGAEKIYVDGSQGGAGGVIQIISSSGVISSEATMKLQKGNNSCTDRNEDSGDGFLLIEGINNISAINVAFISGRAKHRQPALPYEVVLSGTSPGKLVTS